MNTNHVEGGTPPARGSADSTPVSEIMSRNVIAVRRNMTTDELERLFLAQRISGAPVVNDRGRPIGIVSKSDILREKGAPAAPGSCVRDVMLATSYCMSENESIACAAGLLSLEELHCVPVVGSKGTVVGVVFPLDIARWLARQHGYTIGNRP
jgi:CBS domain-containing membrane protein